VLEINWKFFCRHNPIKTTWPTLYDDKPVQSANLLCIHLTAKLNMSEHAEQTVSVCNQSLYLWCQLKWQNLPVECLDSVSNAILPVLSVNYCMLKSVQSFIVWNARPAVTEIHLTSKPLLFIVCKDHTEKFVTIWETNATLTSWLLVSLNGLVNTVSAQTFIWFVLMMCSYLYRFLLFFYCQHVYMSEESWFTY